MNETMSQALPAFQNRQLFSNHYLDNRLRADDLWTSVAGEADRLRQVLRGLLQTQSGPLAGASESQTEERWCQPVLKALGWGYEVQPVSRRHGSTQFPDYALFLTQEEADRAASTSDRRPVLKAAAGVLEAKRWGRDLDARDSEAADRLNQVPSTQIINYLIRAGQPWGILTNGIEWRLYYRDADFADTSYFAVSLPALLGDRPLSIGERGDSISPDEAFRYFYLFFRPEAFRIAVDGSRWLDLANRASVRYARAVEEALKPRAYRAVEAICRGFAAATAEDPRGIASDPTRGAVFLDNALTLLFRLLFLLYAESRDLLPVRTSPAYRRKSLLQLRERAARVRDTGEALFPRGQDFWSDLHDLFRIVDGDPAWRAVGVPVYNGGLFDPAKHPWLEQNCAADPQLAEAIDLLSRTMDPETGSLHYVDYGTLDVRNLGSIYEGLLEHVIDTDEGGDLVLVNDRGERKATGSYYTPHFVVEYIVEKTLTPLVQGRTPREILDLKLVDPAMGSGHFLVSATSFLARAAVRAVEEEPAGLGDLARLDPERLRRLVVERCIFGVDRNPRAVELAKLSLWIATVQRDKPLNFLDHHLKTGDSLLGARVERLGGLPGRQSAEAAREEAGQINAFERAFQSELVGILDSIQAIESNASETLSDIERKEALHRQADALIARFRTVADLWCSALLGGAVDGDRYGRALDALHGYPGQWNALAREDWMVEAKRLARRHRFFHWELEFGEVFFEDSGGRKADPGFDAVIGNPPYVRMEAFKEIKDFLRALFESYATRSDLYVYFMERSIDLLHQGGRYGVIVSNKFLRAGYGARLRALVGREATVEEIVDFGGLPVFPEATVRAAILLAERGHDPEWTPRYAAIARLDFEDLSDEVESHAFELDPSSLGGEEWRIAPRRVARLLDKLESAGEPLAQVLDQPIVRGIVTGLNEAFFLDDETRERLVGEDARSAEVIKPLVVGSEIGRYHIEREGRWLLYLPHGIDISRYPAIERHLEPFRERLEKRATKQERFELQQPQTAYVEYFEGPKILYPVIARGVRFAFTQEALYPNDKCFLISDGDQWILALLNSQVALFYLRQILARLEGHNDAGSYLEFRAQYMERLPIRRAPETTPAQTRRELGAWLQSLYYRGLKLAGVQPDIPPEIQDLGPRIGAIDGIERVVLVGSWARGHAREDSDVDLVVVQEPNGSKADQRRRIRETLGDFPRAFDLHLYTPEEIRERTGGFLTHALEEGIELYGA